MQGSATAPPTSGPSPLRVACDVPLVSPFLFPPPLLHGPVRGLAAALLQTETAVPQLPRPRTSHSTELASQPVSQLPRQAPPAHELSSNVCPPHSWTGHARCTSCTRVWHGELWFWVSQQEWESAEIRSVVQTGINSDIYCIILEHILWI